MASLQRRLGTTEDLRSLVATMKALSTVNIRQYERAVASVRVYYGTVERGLRVLVRDPRFRDAPRRRVRAGRAAIVMGSDYGLCGQFNDEVARFAADRLGTDRGECPQALVSVGARVAARLEGLGLHSEEILAPPSSAAGIEASVRQILLLVDRWDAERGLGRVLLVHHVHDRGEAHPDGAGPRVRAERILPLDRSRLARLAREPWPTRCLPTFRESPDVLASALVRQYLFVALFRALAESAAAEHASRLETMQGAERNLEDRMDELRRELQHRRQAAITAELLDVVSGFEALGGESGAQGSSG